MVSAISLYATVTTFEASVTSVTTVPTAISLRVPTTPLPSTTIKFVFELDDGIPSNLTPAASTWKSVLGAIVPKPNCPDASIIILSTVPVANVKPEVCKFKPFVAIVILFFNWLLSLFY